MDVHLCHHCINQPLVGSVLSRAHISLYIYICNASAAMLTPACTYATHQQPCSHQPVHMHVHMPRCAMHMCAMHMCACCTHACTHVFMHVCMCACMYACMLIELYKGIATKHPHLPHPRTYACRHAYNACTSSPTSSPPTSSVAFVTASICSLKLPSPPTLPLPSASITPPTC